MKVWIKSVFNDDLRAFDVLIWNKKPHFDKDGLIYVNSTGRRLGIGELMNRVGEMTGDFSQALK